MLQWEDPSNSFLEATSAGNWMQAWMIYIVVVVVLLLLLMIMMITMMILMMTADAKKGH